MFLAQKHIQRIYNESSSADRMSQNLAQMLNMQIETGFSGGSKYIHELIQNADDSAVNSQPLEMSISLMDDYLVVAHSGKHFTAGDVEQIKSKYCCKFPFFKTPLTSPHAHNIA